MPMDVAGKTVNSPFGYWGYLLCLTSFFRPLISRACTVLGLTTKPTSLPFPPPLCCLWEGHAFPPSFLVMPECPRPLLGWDNLQKLRTRATLGEWPSQQTPLQMLVLTDKDNPGQSLDRDLGKCCQPNVWDHGIPGTLSQPCDN